VGTTTSSASDSHAELLPRLHSLAGVVPAATFFAVHLWINARALEGRRAYDGFVSALQAVPGRAFVEAVFIGAPLLFHAGYGLLIAAGRAPAQSEPPETAPWSRSMQRVTGIAAAVFIGLHLATIRLPTLFDRVTPADFYPLLSAELSATAWVGIPAWGAGYLIGLAAVSYHLANGLSRFCLRSGMGAGRRGLRAVSLGTGLLGAALFLLGTNTVVYFATGASLLGAIRGIH
jgi:succinate dehydrogenase/fumarate reductase cytochrome b subunit (b558 family)